MIFKYTTLLWIWFWAMITLMMAWLAQRTQSDWIFVATMVSAVILVGGTILLLGKWGRRRCNLQRLDVGFLIPQSKYPFKSFDGAPEKAKTVKKLTLGKGTYTLLLAVKARANILLDPIVLVFEGNEVNRPKLYGKVDIYEKLAGGSERDWWGTVSPPVDKYPQPFYQGQTIVDGNKIETTGSWTGKLHVQIPVREETIVHKHLDITVATNNDDIPFLRVIDEGAFGHGLRNAIRPAATTQI